MLLCFLFTAQEKGAHALGLIVSLPKLESRIVPPRVWENLSQAIVFELHLPCWKTPDKQNHVLVLTALQTWSRPSSPPPLTERYRTAQKLGNVCEDVLFTPFLFSCGWWTPSLPPATYTQPLVPPYPVKEIQKKSCFPSKDLNLKTLHLAIRIQVEF